MTTTETPTPLDMARNWASTALGIARHYEERERQDPGFGAAEARVHGAGRQQFEAAQMASFMALVSIAEDLHRLVGQEPGHPVSEPERGWPVEWDLVGRDGDGNAILKHKLTGGRYRIIPEEDL